MCPKAAVFMKSQTSMLSELQEIKISILKKYCLCRIEMSSRDGFVGGNDEAPRVMTKSLC